jgi:pilus assembly protein CpaE
MNAPWNPNKRSGGIALREPFTAFVCDEAAADLVRGVAGEIGWAADKVNKGGLRNAVQTLSVSASPHVLLVDLTECGDPLNDINALAEVCEPGTVVIAMGALNDVRLYRDLLGSGIQDYLLKPVSEDALRDSLMAAQAALHGPKTTGGTDDSGRPRLTITVLGVRGGVGSSTVATSLAWLLSEAGRPTALLDLDIHFGTGALAFDLEPGRGLTDALENPSRIDGLFIERAMVRASEKLAVLSAEAPINQPLLADGGALFHLQEEMRGAFESVVIDLPRALAVQHPHLLGESNHVVVVTEQTLAATRDTIRLLGWLKQQAPGARVTVVANRVSANPPPEVNAKDFAASIEHAVDVTLPLDAKTVINAAKQGKCVGAVAKGSKVGSGLDALLAIIGGDQAVASDDAAKPSLFDRIGFSALLKPKARA